VTVKVASGGGGSGTVALPELWADLNPDSAVDQTDALQGAIDEAQAGERLLRIAPTIQPIRFTQVVIDPDTAPLYFKGCGKQQTIFQVHDDAGAGVVAIRTEKGESHILEDFALLGSQETQTVGELPMAMSGLRMEGLMVAREVRVSSFKAGIEIVNDHQHVEYCDLQGNAFGLLWDHNPVGGLGDHRILGTQLANQTRASIGIDSSNAMLNARFGQNGHIGIAPFGIYRFDTVWACTGTNGSPTLSITTLPYIEADFALSAFVGCRIRGTNIPDGTTITNLTGTGPYSITMSANATGAVTGAVIGERGNAMDGVTFENYSFEYCNHMEIYDEPGTGSFSFTMGPPAESSTGGAPVTGPEWEGKPVGTAAIYVGYLIDCHWTDGPFYAQDGRPALAAKQFTNIRVDEYRNERENLANDSGYAPIAVIAGADSPKVNGITLGTGGAGSNTPRCGAFAASGAIAQYDLLEYTGYGQVKVSTNSATSLIAGVAVQAAADGEVVIVDVEGSSSTTKVRNKTGGEIANGALLKPDSSNAGGVAAASGINDGPIIGRVNDGAIAAGTSGKAWLTVR
jgi:hypothetical protein